MSINVIFHKILWYYNQRGHPNNKKKKLVTSEVTKKCQMGPINNYKLPLIL